MLSLRDAAISMVVDADVPIVAERAMYWPGPSGSGWLEAHNSPGTTETGTVWAIAGGEMGGANATQTFVLIANTSNFAGSARVTVLREGATPLVKVVDLLPDSRQNVNIGDYPEFAPVANSRFGVLIESLGATPRADRRRARDLFERRQRHDLGGRFELPREQDSVGQIQRQFRSQSGLREIRHT